ncbi:MAG TPA: NapC/NirT family cytochrome c [Dehalococcoidia bacterium]|nr:NapC/NirT family cytochrome c [Dehalococcoidia bacterium]
MGGILAVVAFGGLVFFLGIQLLAVRPSPYLGMLVYLGLPAVLVLGLVLIPAGILWEARRRAAAARRGGGPPPALLIDFGNPRHLRGILLFATLTVVILGVLGSTGYRTVEFMDSPSFCGTLCHTVMKPQYEPYKRSAHAQVNCTSCHIGPGAGWYVQSKLSGVQQAWAVITGSYPRPIPVPITHLRPARDTCEGCHWREKAYGLFLRVYRSYLPDETNTSHVRALAFRVGTGGSKLEEAGGVHWHTSARLWYRSADKERQTIARVRVEKPDKVEEWANPDVPQGAPLAEERLMDCIDCHNRAAHKIPAPDQLIDDALTAGRLDSGLPYLKRESLRLLGQDGSLTSPEELASRWARDGWFEQLAEFYQQNYPDAAASQQASIQQAIAELKRMSKQVLYPEMKSDWLTYADNRGHPGLEGINRGCFRCHTTLVNAATGQRLPGGVGGTGCLACHGLGEQGNARLGGDPVAEPECAYCHVPIPLKDLERPVP